MVSPGFVLGGLGGGSLRVGSWERPVVVNRDGEKSGVDVALYDSAAGCHQPFFPPVHIDF